MKLALDISQIVYKGSGVGRFTEGLVRAICEYETTNHWVFFFSSLRNSIDPSIKELIRAKGFELVETKIPPTVLSILWNQLHFFPIERFVGNVDWVITSDWTEPPSKCKKATIVHDLVFMKYPETVDELIRKTQEQRLRWVQKESSVIFADSDSTKNDLEKLLFIEKDRVIVNYPGITQANRKIHDTRYTIHDTRPFILTVGKLEPRKNIERLVDAFNKLNRKDLDLYIVGMTGWGNVRVEQNQNIKLLGFISDDELAKLYRSCLFFVLPSIYEGFGYPVIEAMSHGAAVATSSTSSLHEIAGDSALLFDPTSTESITKALQKLVDSSSLRKQLSIKGIKRAKEFTWKRYYETMIKTLQNHNS